MVGTQEDLRTRVRLDRNAFIRFLPDEHPVVVRLSDWVPTCEEDYIRCIEPRKVLDAKGDRIGGWWFKIPGSAKLGWPDELMPLATCLYTFVRNSLTHEEILPDNVEFIEGQSGSTTFEVSEDRLRISNSLMDGLCGAMAYAPENSDLFPDIAETPRDIIAWMLFGKAGDKRQAYKERQAKWVESANPRASLP